MIHIEFARRGLSILSHCGSWGRADGRASFAPPARILRGDLGRLAGLVGLDCDPDAHFLAQSGLDRLDLAAPGALAGSFWLLCALLGAPAGSIWLPTITPSTRLAPKKTICLSTILLRCCLLRALWNVSSCLKSS